MAGALPIEVRGLTKVYHTDFWKKPVAALRGLDLSVEAGEIFGFIGPKSSGLKKRFICIWTIFLLGIPNP